MRPRLHLRYARGTTAHVASLYPFSLRPAAGAAGAYVGLDVLSGGGEFCWDPFEAYAAGAVTNPNAWIFGEPGNGKSALVKCLLWRMAGLYGTGMGGRWFAIADPKGEYASLAQRLGLAVVRLAPGGSVRVNPLEPGPGDEGPEQATARRADMVAALAATVLRRALSPLEDAAVFAVVEALGRRREPATLADLAGALARPGEELARGLRAGTDELAAALAPLAFALDKLVSRSLRGMFDGRSTVSVSAQGPGIVVDLSAIPIDSEAMPLVMVAAAGWLGRMLAAPGPQRVQVIDEAWALLGNRHTASYLQACFKLGRTYGVANLCVAHRPSDLGAQADDGTATAKIAAGLLADAATKVVLRQAPDQLARAGEGFGLTEPERQIVAQLARGRALWKVAGRTAVVQHVLSPAEAGDLTDTDARMAGDRAA
jgi:type IV secretory pathway VirB4 component